MKVFMKNSLKKIELTEDKKAYVIKLEVGDNQYKVFDVDIESIGKMLNPTKKEQAKIDKYLKKLNILASRTSSRHFNSLKYGKPVSDFR